MIRFCYSSDGNYNLQNIPDRIESFLIDKKNQKLRVFDAEDFYFSVLDSSYIDSSNPSVGLSMLGANRLYNELDLLGQVFDNYVNELLDKQIKKDIPDEITEETLKEENNKIENMISKQEEEIIESDKKV